MDLDLLMKETIKVEEFGVKIILPHPICYGLHKLIVISKRTDKNKIDKDVSAGINVLQMIMKAGETRKMKKVFQSLSKKQQRIILKTLNDQNEEQICESLKEK